MKWFSVLPFALLATASPIERDDRITVYKLKTQSSTAALDGMYLQIRNNTVGVWRDKKAAQQAEVYPIESPNKGQVELHTWPIGIVDHVLGLVGGDSVMNLQDIAMPAATTWPQGTKADWTSFTMKVDPQSDGAEGEVGYAGQGRWVAFPTNNGGYRVTILTGKGFTTQDYLPITVSFERAKGKP